MSEETTTQTGQETTETQTGVQEPSLADALAAINAINAKLETLTAGSGATPPPAAGSGGGARVTQQVDISKLSPADKIAYGLNNKGV